MRRAASRLLDERNDLPMTEFNNGEEACFLNDFLCQLNGGPSVFPARTPLAMAYVPYQEFEDLSDASAALEVNAYVGL